MIINIGATANPDLPIAQALASRFNGYIIWGQIDLSQITEDIIIVGGQLANQTYNWLVQQGHVPSLKPTTTGFGSIFYLKLFGRNIRVITGWDVEDTEAAGLYAINMGLPWVSRVIPLTTDKQAIQINFPYASDAGMDLLDSNIGDVMIEITNKIGTFGLIDSWVDKQGKNLFLLRDKTALRLAGIVIPAALIYAIAALIGLFYLGWVWKTTRHEAEVTNRADIRRSVVEKCLELPEDQALECIKNYYSGEEYIMKRETKFYEIFDIIKWSILLAVIGFGGYYVTKGIISFRKSKEG